MAITFSFDEIDSMEIADFIEVIRTQFDVTDQAAVAESAVFLARLGNNRTIFSSIIDGELRRGAWTGGLQEGYNTYTDATFLLGGSGTGDFYVRANVWKSVSKIDIHDNPEVKFYSYLEAHDHNFDFVTVGYHGPGYRTKIYEYDNDRVAGRAGEKVDIRFLEETTLPVGKVMMYRKSEDIHIQIPPPAMSISLNLMIPPPNMNRKEQYYFDIGSSMLAGFVPGRSSYQVSAIELAGALSDDNYLDPLFSIAQGSNCARTRAEAIRAISHIARDLGSEVVLACEHDSSPVVQSALDEIRLAI